MYEEDGKSWPEIQSSFPGIFYIYAAYTVKQLRERYKNFL